MNRIFTVSTLFFCLQANAQTSVYVDPRDQQSYKTIVIGNKTWFRENLRFQSSRSFCPNFNKDSSDCMKGNFYSNTELDAICPPGWHVNTIQEWEDFIRFLIKEKALDPASYKYDSSVKVPGAYSMSIKSIDLFTDTTLNFPRTGWVEGYKLKKNQSATIWVVDTDTKDDKYHIHFGVGGFIKHSHEHNIIDKPTKIRKFPVRCVCELKKEPG